MIKEIGSFFFKQPLYENEGNLGIQLVEVKEDPVLFFLVEILKEQNPNIRLYVEILL